MKTIFSILLVLTSTQVLAFQNGGVGHDTIPKVAPESVRTDINFNVHSQDDFNRDGHPDRLICNHTQIDGRHRINVQIKNGLNNQDIFRWNWSESGTYLRNGGDVLLLTGCDIVYLQPNRPSIILSTAYNRVQPAHGVRIIAPQFIIHNQSSNNQLVPKHIRIPGRNDFFKSAARSVKCTQVPHALRSNGVQDGAYCFYAGYDGPLSFSRGYGTVSVLAKFEQGPGDTFVVKDLTQESGLPWPGGMLGTPMEQIRTANMCSRGGIKDGLHMMEGAFLDFNRDGFTDLVTVGQHASIRSHRMVLDNSKREKFSFHTSFIHDVHTGGMSEFLKVISLNENESHASSTCVYISGEKSNGCGSVSDHMRCFKNGQWETSFPEGERFSSEMTGAIIKANGQGRLIIKSNIVTNGRKTGEKFFRLDSAYNPQKILMSVAKPIERANDFIVKGWACVPNTGWRPRITIRNKPSHTSPGYRTYYQSVVNESSEPALQKVCMQKGSYPLRFQAIIPKHRLTIPTGHFHIQADFYHHNQINVPHERRIVAY